MLAAGDPCRTLVAASLHPGSEVLVAADEFNSVSFSFLAQPGVTVREVGLADLPDAVTLATAWIAVAAAQSAGWLPVDAPRWSVTVTGGLSGCWPPGGRP